ncbi:MAG: nitroreductase [Chloroflexota bacterium]
MINWGKTLIDGLLLSVISSFILILSLNINPRTFLQDYPKDIQSKVPPKTPNEKRLSLLLGIPFLLALIIIPFISTLRLKLQLGANSSFMALFLNAFGVTFTFNLVDWLLLDWLMFCTITPKFVVIPGTEGLPGYKDYAFHFRGFIIGTFLSTAFALLTAVVVFFLF